jgi:prepilin-type N-terminal cleavage/methylation domain-containing protein
MGNRLRHRGVSRDTSKSAFTLIELLISISIIAVLISIMVPALTRARSYGRLTSCLSNLRGQGLSLLSYTIDYEGAMPPRLEWDYSNIDGWLIDEILSKHDHQEFDPPLKPNDWCRPVGIWRCPDSKDADRRTHSGILYYAPNLWLFNYVVSYDGQGYDIEGDAPAGWDDPGSWYESWRQVGQVRQPSDIIAMADNVNYFHPPHNTRESRESMGYSWQIETDPADSEDGVLRASHARLAKRPCLMVDGHAESLPPGPAYWEDPVAPYHPRSNPGMTAMFHPREVQRFMWFMSSDEIGPGVTSAAP